MNVLLNKVPKEVYIRQEFAMNRWLYYLNKINNCKVGGNIMTCKWSEKFIQAVCIYKHYRNVYNVIGGLVKSEHPRLTASSNPNNNRKNQRR